MARFIEVNVVGNKILGDHGDRVPLVDEGREQIDEPGAALLGPCAPERHLFGIEVSGENLIRPRVDRDRQRDAPLLEERLELSR